MKYSVQLWRCRYDYAPLHTRENGVYSGEEGYCHAWVYTEVGADTPDCPKAIKTGEHGAVHMRPAGIYEFTADQELANVPV